MSGSTKEMTLSMRIKANAAEATRMFKELNHGFVELQKTAKETSQHVSSALHGIGSLASAAFAPLRMAAGAASMLAGGLVTAGGAALYAAAENEKLQSRLAGVAGSAALGAHAMEVLESMSRHSAFKTDDLAEAAITMRQYGMASQRSLRAVAAAAKVAGMDVGTLAFQTMALQARGLKHFGIEIDDTKDNPVIRWRDHMNKIHTITTKTADEARQKLVDVFAFKFGTDISPKTLSGLWQMLKNNLEQVMESFGSGLLAPAKRFIDYISGGLVNAIESGKIEEWGKKAGAWLNDAVTKFMATIDTLKQSMSFLPKLLEGTGEGLKSVLSAIVVGLGKTLGTAFIEYLVASTKIFVALGKLIANALKESFLSLDIPGMRTLRFNAFKDSLQRMTPEQAKAFGLPSELGNRAVEGPSIDPQIFQEMYADKITAAFNKLSPQQQAGLASFDSGTSMADAVKSIATDLKTAGENVGRVAKESLAGVGSAFKVSTGFDFKDEWSKNYARRTAEADTHGFITARFTELAPIDPSNPLRRKPTARDVVMPVDDITKYHIGQQGRGGAVIINISKMNVTSSDAGRATNEIINAALRGSAHQYAH